MGRRVTENGIRVYNTTLPKPKTKTNPKQTYVAFENQRNAKIHLTTCQEYQTRKADSIHDTKGLQVGTWNGPYHTIQEAIVNAVKTGKAIRHCTKCIKTK